MAFRRGLISPTLVAQMAPTFQRPSGNRLLLNVVTGGESSEQRGYGDFLGKDARYARTDEFLGIIKALWRGETVDHVGEHLRVDGARLSRLPDPAPEIYFGGSSAAAGPVAARHTDGYLTWGEPPAQVAKKIEWIRGLNPALRFGIRLHVIARDTAAAAWAEADRLLQGVSPADIEAVQAGLRRSEAYWFGDGVLPEQRRRGRWRHPDGDGNTRAASIRSRAWPPLRAEQAPGPVRGPAHPAQRQVMSSWRSKVT